VTLEEAAAAVSRALKAIVSKRVGAVEQVGMCDIHSELVQILPINYNHFNYNHFNWGHCDPS
jgi:hypothetical protein